MSSINEERTVNHGIDEAGPDMSRGKHKPSIRISSLPESIRASAAQLDKDGDGALGASEVGFTIQDLDKNKNENRNLKMAVAAFALLTVLLVGCIFAASITAANLSKDINVSSGNGFAYVKGSNEVMKTSEAIVYTPGTDIAAFSDAELLALSKLVLDDGRLKFTVYGFSRGDENNPDTVDTVMLQVIGGTITYDATGIIDATGDAKALIEYHFGSTEDDADIEGDAPTPNRRRLAIDACTMNGAAGSTETNYQMSLFASSMQF